jgi:ABC-type antimicrobial peptide transport system permease subunit
MNPDSDRTVMLKPNAPLSETEHLRSNNKRNPFIASLLKNWHCFVCLPVTNFLLMLIRNYYRSAVRHISRDRFFAGLNIIGLSIGVAFFLLVGAFAWSEWRVNRDLRHAGRQYFLESEWKNGLGPAITTLGQLAPALKANYPSLVANYFRWDGIECNISLGDSHFREAVAVADSTMLDMYGFRLLAGDPHTAMNDPFTIVITASKALKFFGRTDVVGRSLVVANNNGDQRPFRITGVMEEPPRNSVTRLIDAADNHVFIPVISQSFFGRNMVWQNIYTPSYVELQPGVQPEQLTEPIRHLIQVNTPQFAPGLRVVPKPLTDYYLASEKKIVTTLFYISTFILLMAVINFINLAVGRSASRMKEIGVRKVLGGMRRQLIGQFLTESILLAVLSTGLALFIYSACLRFFSNMTGKELPGLPALPVQIWVLLPIFALVLGGLAGLYPALILSSLSSVDSMKGKSGSIREHTLLRKGLVGFQFGIAIIALVAVAIISQQVRLFFSDKLGYSKDYVISAQVPRDWSLLGVEHIESVRNVFASMPGVKEAALSYEIPNGNNGSSIGLYTEGGDSTRAVITKQFVADEHYASVYQIPLAAGVFFNKTIQYNGDDSMRVVINESAAQALGFKQPGAAIGRRVKVVNFLQAFTISGVVKDFHFDDMGAPVTPEIFMHPALANVYRFMSFKLKPGNVSVTLADLEQQWHKLLPVAPFDFQFMDETLSTIYTAELRLEKAADIATVLSLVIVIMGVIGLVSLSVQKRTKEIAIRKVIGASVPGIVRLFMREYLLLLLAAGVIASPLAWWLLQRWLDDYSTRITITVIPFAVVLLSLTLLMALLIVGQTVRAALSNPVKSLKTE